MGRITTAIAVIGTAALLFACSRAATLQEVVSPPAAAVQTVHYRTDVQPIFEQKCAACHSCNDAPCQLKLTSWQGVERGASKIPVYDGTRDKDQAPTRLGIDALRTSDWRQMGFFSAQYAPLDDKATATQSSLLYKMIALGHANPWTPNAKIPDDIELGRERPNECPTMDEFKGYSKDRPLQGMPLAVTGLTDKEFQTLKTWTEEGSVVEPSLLMPSAAESKAIRQWEEYLNRPGVREQLVARYLFEHLFLAHIHFLEEDRPHFFELVRSRTPSGQDLVPVSTPTPNGDAGGPVFYRFRLITDTIVEKTHITYALGEQKRRRYDELFFGTPWTVDTLPGYTDTDRANAFATFAAIPAKARYQFMLDNAEYFVRTFIRGPVCAGQIATDVIRDQFWVSFENPDTERYVNDATYRQKATPLIGVPGQDSDLIGTVEQWEHYRDQRNHYIALRQAEYARDQPSGPSFDDLWDGDGTNRDALLTIFRHHDNAAVRHGLIGTLPETLWVMDYPLLERSYYQLVVNFNVFGSVSHQLQTRLYFDLIRNEGEYNFLRFLPGPAREKLRKSWYRGGGKLKLFMTYAEADDKTPTRIVYRTKDPKAEFADQLFEHMKKVMGSEDVLNRCPQGGCEPASTSREVRQTLAELGRLAGKTGDDLPVIPLLPELVYLRVTVPGKDTLLYALVHNRAHKNVAFLLGEEGRLEPGRDTVTVVQGTIGSYPNFLFDLPQVEVGAFVDALSSVKTPADFERVVERWGVRRTRPDFWTVFHDLTRYLERTDPTEAGLFDMNRYVNL
ncbi:fatty acid cis/trans isomerase CTI [Panacagrimonas perspica]|uniref:Fatty acid cis/trans isomerase CTI n=1 Tax=Panacagrimonas perspica TaxID=381431 RepID=A0A4V3F5Y7_9GAMM|nr:fatty acid cis/trans isomerase [Panacagrimonas perspica]TDU26386.1 fatty acid cis/trans isomerase CTI [Panacagrimonas perspica]